VRLHDHLLAANNRKNAGGLGCWVPYAGGRDGATMIPMYSQKYLFFLSRNKDTSIYTHVHILVSQVLFLTEMRIDERFRKVKNLPDLSIMIVETKLHNRHEIVYKLLKLVLVLPVAIASVEIIFSAMNYVKNKLRNKLGDHT
jgi:hypothetical protein